MFGVIQKCTCAASNINVYENAYVLLQFPEMPPVHGD